MNIDVLFDMMAVQVEAIVIILLSMLTNIDALFDMMAAHGCDSCPHAFKDRKERRLDALLSHIQTLQPRLSHSHAMSMRSF